MVLRHFCVLMFSATDYVQFARKIKKTQPDNVKIQSASSYHLLKSQN